MQRAKPTKRGRSEFGPLWRGIPWSRQHSRLGSQKAVSRGVWLADAGVADNASEISRRSFRGSHPWADRIATARSRGSEAVSLTNPHQCRRSSSGKTLAAQIMALRSHGA